MRVEERAGGASGRRGRASRGRPRARDHLRVRGRLEPGAVRSGRRGSRRAAPSPAASPRVRPARRRRRPVRPARRGRPTVDHRRRGRRRWRTGTRRPGIAPRSRGAPRDTPGGRSAPSTGGCRGGGPRPAQPRRTARASRARASAPARARAPTVRGVRYGARVRGAARPRTPRGVAGRRPVRACGPRVACPHGSRTRGRRAVERVPPRGEHDLARTAGLAPDPLGGRGRRGRARHPGGVGTPTGQEVLEILGKRRTDLTAEDERVMRNVVQRVTEQRRDDLEPTAGEAHWGTG